MDVEKKAVDVEMDEKMDMALNVVFNSKEEQTDHFLYVQMVGPISNLVEKDFCRWYKINNLSAMSEPLYLRNLAMWKSAFPSDVDVAVDSEPSGKSAAREPLPAVLQEHIFLSYIRKCGSSAYGSKLYVFGGYLTSPKSPLENQTINHVYVYDVITKDCSRHPQNMLCPRVHPAAVTIDNKIYIFGSTSVTSQYVSSFGEVLNTETGQFSSLPDPPKDLIQSWLIRTYAVMSTSNGDMEILFLSRTFTFFLYNVSHNNWKRVFTIRPYPYSFKLPYRSVAIGDILYLYNGISQMIMGCNMRRDGCDSSRYEWLNVLDLGLVICQTYRRAPFVDIHQL